MFDFMFALCRLGRLMPVLLLALGGTAAMAQGAEPRATHAMPGGRPIADRYIVVFRSSVASPSQEADNLIRGTGGQIHHKYTHAIKGFAATIPPAALNGLRNNPNVESVEQDTSVQLNQVSSPQMGRPGAWTAWTNVIVHSIPNINSMTPQRR